MSEQQDPIEFGIPREQVEAIEMLAGARKVRLSGEVRDGRLVVDTLSFADESFSQATFVPVNAPFKTAENIPA
jgi:hypothetical protein